MFPERISNKELVEGKKKFPWHDWGKKEFGIIVIMLLILAISGYKTWKQKELKERLIHEKNYVIGEIIDHRVSRSDDSDTYYVKCKYYVNDILYHKEMSYSGTFNDCHETRNCIGRRFIVYYDQNNPHTAYMDLDNEWIPAGYISRKTVGDSIENAIKNSEVKD